MKKTIRQSFALILIGALLCMGMPFALADTATYSDVDYSTTLTVGEALSAPVPETAPCISNLLDWGGYAQGYTMELEAGTEYTVTARVSAEGAVYSDRRLAILRSNLSGNPDDDILTAPEGVIRDSDSVILRITFTPEVTGEYRLLAWGYLEDNGGNKLFGEGTLMEVMVKNTADLGDAVEIRIKTPQDLLDLHETVAALSFDTPKVSVFLENNLDLSGQSYTPAETAIPLEVFGQEYTVSGLSTPLFHNIFSLAAYDLTVDLAFSMQSGDSLSSWGGLVDYANSVELSNCHATGYVTLENYDKITALGGLVGQAAENLCLYNCSSTVDFTLKNSRQVSNVGGLVGVSFGDEDINQITKCTYQGSMNIDNISGDAYGFGGILGRGEYYNYLEDCSTEIEVSIQNVQELYEIGGLAGSLEDYNSVKGCHAKITVDAPAVSIAGGLAGYIDEENQIINSWAEGSILARASAGGLVGASDCCGGNLFANCCTTVDVTAETYAGGFIGSAYYGDSFINCYAAGTVTAPAGEEAIAAEEEPAYWGNFLGYDCSLSSDENGNAISSVSFDSCFFAENQALPAIGYGLPEAEGLTSVDFSDATVVQAMTDALNARAEQGLGTGTLLYPWVGQNEAGGPVPTKFNYMLVDYSTTLTLGEKNDRPLEKAYEISVNLASWSGYPMGYTVALEAGKEYLFDATVSGEETVYVDRALAILPETLTGVEEDDFLDYNTDSAEKDCKVSLIFAPEVSGNYKVLAWGYCENNGGTLFGEGTQISMQVRAAPEQPDLILDIDSEEDLAGLAAALESHPEALWPQINFLADLDMKDTKYTLPTTDALYKITAKGNGHTVAGMTSPLFDTVETLEVSKLTLKGSLVYERPEESDSAWRLENIGFIANRVNDVTATDCLVEGTISTKKVNELSDVGGLFGDTDGTALLTKCTALVDIVMDSPSYATDIGGLIGDADGEGFLAGCTWKGKIEILGLLDDAADIGGLLGDADSGWILGNCVAEGSIQVVADDSIYLDNAENSIGGLAGDLGSNCAINLCHAKVDIDAPFVSAIGGLFGSMDSTNTIDNSFAEGSLIGHQAVGGLIGSSDGETGENLIINCYSTATVEATALAGGLVGVSLASDVFDNCYAAGTVSAKAEDLPDEGEPAPAEESDAIPVPAPMGAFLGRVLAAGEAEPSFTNCFAAKQEGLTLIGGVPDIRISGITAVDFSDDDAVQAMTDTLNARVKEYNAQEDVILTLLSWGDKNESGGPMLLRVNYGDADGNGKVDAADALKALQHAVKLITLEGSAFAAADVNGDEKVDATDALLMLQYTVKLIDIFPVQK